jgi:hypothetical protein
VTLVRPDTELGWDKRIAGEDGQVGQTVKGCWAASLGDCKGKISREHLVSECLLPEGGIRVSGFPWCKDEPKFVGNAALVGNILCEKHNSELSELDSSAKRSFDILNESWRLYGIRSKIINRRWPQKTFIIDGVLLERWFVKTFINLNHGGPWIIGEGSHAAGMPNDELVRIAFGRAAFREKAGLYTAFYDGEQEVLVYPGLSLTTKTIGNNVMAGMFLLAGMPFFLSLIQKDLHEDQGACLFHHLKHFQYSTHDDKRRPVKSHRVDIVWP